jgi:hypothetical protein
MFDGVVHYLPFVSNNVPFFREFFDTGLEISVERILSKFSESLVTIERDTKKYKKAVENFSRSDS